MDTLNAVKSVLADVRASDEGLTLGETSANTLYDVQRIHINLTLIHCTFTRNNEVEKEYSGRHDSPRFG